MVRPEGRKGGGRRGDGGRVETAGGFEQCCAVEMTVGYGENESTCDGPLDVSAEDFQGL